MNKLLIKAAYYNLVGCCQGGFENMFPQSHYVNPLLAPESALDAALRKHGQVTETIVDHNYIANLYAEEDLLIHCDEDVFLISIGGKNFIKVVNEKPCCEVTIYVDGEYHKCSDEYDLGNGEHGRSEMESANNLNKALIALMTPQEREAYEHLAEQAKRDYYAGMGLDEDYIY